MNPNSPLSPLARLMKYLALSTAALMVVLGYRLKYTELVVVGAAYLLVGLILIRLDYQPKTLSTWSRTWRTHTPSEDGQSSDSSPSVPYHQPTSVA